MKTYKNLYPQIIAFDNLYQAWRRARTGKPYKPTAASFGLGFPRQSRWSCCGTSTHKIQRCQILERSWHLEWVEDDLQLRLLLPNQAMSDVR